MMEKTPTEDTEELKGELEEKLDEVLGEEEIEAKKPKKSRAEKAEEYKRRLKGIEEFSKRIKGYYIKGVDYFRSLDVSVKEFKGELKKLIELADELGVGYRLPESVEEALGIYKFLPWRKYQGHVRTLREIKGKYTTQRKRAEEAEQGKYRAEKGWENAKKGIKIAMRKRRAAELDADRKVRAAEERSKRAEQQALAAIKEKKQEYGEKNDALKKEYEKKLRSSHYEYTKKIGTLEEEHVEGTRMLREEIEDLGRKHARATITLKKEHEGRIKGYEGRIRELEKECSKLKKVVEREKRRKF